MLTIMQPSASHCATHLLETVPIAMRFIQGHIRRERIGGLTLVQLRVLGFLGRTQDASLSATADHLGLSLPAMSRLIESLVRRDLVKRRTKATDRRSVALCLSHRGQRLLERARAETRRQLAATLRTLSARERTSLDHALVELDRVFAATCQVRGGEA